MAEGKSLQPNNENYSKQWKQWKTYGQIDENFLGHRFEIQIHIQTQIWLNTIFTVATKHLTIIDKGNLYLHLKTF